VNIKRIVQHLFLTDWQMHRAFSQKSLDAIERAIHASEQLHGGEIRFAIEGALCGVGLLKGQSSRERAIEVFSQLRVWLFRSCSLKKVRCKASRLSPA
jgi:hypothetical protein